MPDAHIYGLIDPESGDLRYIGKSTRPQVRLANHMNDRSACHRSNWLQSLKRRGLKPELIIIETVSGKWPWQESERYWIRRSLAAGMPLTNNTSGGDGVPDLPPETRERIRQASIGRKPTPEALRKQTDARRQRTTSDATRKKMSRTRTGRSTSAWADTVAAGLRKLSASVGVIKYRLDAGEKVKDLAREFVVHRTTISKIKKGTYLERNHKTG